MSEYSAFDNNINKIDTKQAVKIARTTTAKLKPVVKKLTRKIVLKATPLPALEEPVATLEPIAVETLAPVEALEPAAMLEPVAVEALVPTATLVKPKKPVSKGRKKLIIHDA